MIAVRVQALAQCLAADITLVILVRVRALAQCLAADITLVILVRVQALAQCLAADITLVILVRVRALSQCLAADIALVILVLVIMSAFRFIPADRASVLAIAPFAKGVGSFFRLHRATTTISLLVCVFGFDPVSFRSRMVGRIQCAIFLAAGLALCLFLAGGPAASVPTGRNFLHLGLLTDAAGEGPHAGDCAGCGGGDSAVVPGVILGFGDRCSGCDLLFAALAIGIAGIALLSAGGRLGITNLGLGVHTRLCTAPNAVYIVDRSPGFRALCRGVAAVPIAQLGRGDGDRRILWRPVVLNTLIGFAAFAQLALLNIYAGALAGADICAAFSSVDGSRRRQRAVHIDGGI